MSIKKNIRDTSIANKNLVASPEYHWTRPADWLTLPSVGSSDQKTVGLVAIYDNDSNYIAFTATGNFTVDWGDGTAAQNYTSNTTAQYKYDYASISNGTLTSDGFKQVIITITAQSGQTLQTLDFQKFHSDSVTGSMQSWLDITIGITSTFQLANYSTNVAYFNQLKQLSINNHGSSLANTMIRGSAQNISKIFINKALQITSSGPFQYASALEEVYINPACTSADLSNLFLYCYKLKRAPFFDTTGATNITSMFQNCYSLEEVPLYNFASGALVNATSMFNGCYSLKSVPLFNTASIQAFGSMFAGCYNLKTVPLFNTVSATGMSSMFNNCYNLTSVPLFNTANITDATTMFANCYNLQSIPNFNLAKLVTSTSMFTGCVNLKSVPDIFINNLSSLGSMFNSCTTLTKTPPLNNISATTMGTSPWGGVGILEIDRTNLSSLTASATITSGKVRRCQVYGQKYTITFLNMQMGRTALNEVIENAGTAVASQTMTITGNPGATINPVYSRSSTTTSGSTTVALSDTSNLVTGMQITGTGISDGRSVTFTDSGDIVTLAGHGIANGKRVSFSAITSTTGITIYTLYYVVNATTDTFQLSLTAGGSPIALTTDGSGTMLYQTLITNIVANTSVTIDIPASASGTNTLAYRNLNTQIAVMKRWSISG